jgi:DegV family protein with EDD domain
VAVKIVTDSASDIPRETAQKLGINIVPLTIAFGNDVYRDGVDLTPNEFFNKIIISKELPKTAHPSVNSFVETYRSIAGKRDSIVSIHLSQKLSGTCQAAMLARDEVANDCQVNIIDSKTVSMGLGLLVISAARAIRDGATLDQILKLVNRNVLNIRLIAFFQTLEYIYRGGRIGRATTLISSLLHVKPIIVVRDGEAHPFGLARTRTGAIKKLCDFAKALPNIKELSVMYATDLKEVDTLLEMLDEVFPKHRIQLAQGGATLGTHTGPGTLAIAALLA